MKLALIVYHKNADENYSWDWLFKFIKTIKEQTYKDFDIFELEYNAGYLRLFEESKYYEQIKLPTFVDAMNYLLDRVFRLGYDYCCNCNVDDYFALNRIEKQVKYMKQGYDLISSNFALVNNDQITHTHKFHELDIESELERGNNIICHPAACYSKNFWDLNRYIPSEIPFEDMKLWKRAIKNGCTFKILEDISCYHRIHNNSVCQSNNR